MCTGNCVLAVQYKKRNPPYTYLLGFINVLRHRLGILIALEQVLHCFGIEANFSTQFQQGSVVGGVTAFGEIRAEKSLFDGIAQAIFFGQLNEPVRILRTGYYGFIEVESQAHFAGHCRYVVGHAPSFGEAHSFGFGQILIEAFVRLGFHIRV